MRYASIAPLLALPRGLESFTYRVPPEFSAPVGTLVRINFHGRFAVGLVIDTAFHSPILDIKLRPILAVLDAAVYTPEETHVLKNVAHVMMTSVPRLLHYLVPPIPVRWPTAAPLLRDTSKKNYECVVIQSLDEKIIQNKLLGKIKSCLKSKAQVMVVVGRRHEGILLLDFLRAKLPGAQTIFFDQTMPIAARYGAWRSLQDGAEVLIATRAGSFAPAINLGLIIVYNENHDDFKDWGRDPYLDARVVAEHRAKA